MGSLYLRQEQYSRALQLAMLDLSYDNNLPEANEIIGLVYARLRKYEKACPYLRVAFKNGDSSFAVSIAFARALIWCGNYEEAFYRLYLPFQMLIICKKRKLPNLH